MESLKNILTNPLAWIGGIITAVAAFFVGKNTAEPSSQNTDAPNPTAPADGVLVDTGKLTEIRNEKKENLPAKEFATRFTVDKEAYRLTGYRNNEGKIFADGLTLHSGNHPIKIWEFDFLNVKNNVATIDEAKFRKQLDIARAREEADDFTPIEVTRIDKLDNTLPEVEKSDYKNYKNLHIMTVQFQRPSDKKTLERRIIFTPSVTLEGPNPRIAGDISGWMVGVYNEGKPVFSEHKIPLNDNARWFNAGIESPADNNALLKEMQDYVINKTNQNQIKEFVEQIGIFGVKTPDQKQTIQGLNLDRLSRNDIPPGNPNGTLPRANLSQFKTV